MTRKPLSSAGSRGGQAKTPPLSSNPSSARGHGPTVGAPSCSRSHGLTANKSSKSRTSRGQVDMSIPSFVPPPVDDGLNEGSGDSDSNDDGENELENAQHNQEVHEANETRPSEDVPVRKKFIRAYDIKLKFVGDECTSIFKKFYNGPWNTWTDVSQEGKECYFLKFQELCERNKKNRNSSSSGSSTSYRGGCISQSEHRDRMEVRTSIRPSKVEVFLEIYQREDKTWTKERARLTYEKFKEARDEELARLGEGAVIDDDELFIRVSGLIKRRCYGFGNLVDEVSSFIMNTPRTTTDDSDGSLRAQLVSLAKTVQKQNKIIEDNTKRTDMILSILESQGVHLPPSLFSTMSGSGGSGESVSQPLPNLYPHQQQCNEQQQSDQGQQQQSEEHNEEMAQKIEAN
ncbi:Transposase, Ptta/En/Spm, plant [Corchorus olitorius]|uniref:Transposase, Ptta/En/Spm, plant n=1 Tax=Corchorus olitorius TaxID=93759 RepID=A0A1R3G8C9_9ROSI|nr:Transposase, Ptta/En/Spm, plant [Corchorus olitorius]